jgi:hypothetical protein
MGLRDRDVDGSDKLHGGSHQQHGRPRILKLRAALIDQALPHRREYGAACREIDWSTVN